MSRPYNIVQLTNTNAPVPAIVLGGSQNALSVARNLSRQGIEVVAVNYPYEAIRFSRHARYIKLGGDGSPKAWEEFLLGQESKCISGGVLFPYSDEGDLDHSKKLPGAGAEVPARRN